MTETMRATERVYRNADGDLVRGDDPTAAVLVYAVGDEIADEHLEQVKALGKPADKARPTSVNKARG